LRLGVRKLAARESHGLEDLFVLESGLGVRALALFVGGRRLLVVYGPILSRIVHVGPDRVN